MHIINQSTVPIEHRQSPKGTFEVFRKHISIALGGIKDVGPWGGGHPFDIELATIPPRKTCYPYHSHAAQTEYYIILSGTGRLIHGEGKSQAIGPGDHILLLPGEPHQLINDSEQDLVYYVIADHHQADVTSYPIPANATSSLSPGVSASLMSTTTLAKNEGPNKSLQATPMNASVFAPMPLGCGVAQLESLDSMRKSSSGLTRGEGASPD